MRIQVFAIPLARKGAGLAHQPADHMAVVDAVLLFFTQPRHGLGFSPGAQTRDASLARRTGRFPQPAHPRSGVNSPGFKDQDICAPNPWSYACPALPFDQLPHTTCSRLDATMWVRMSCHAAALAFVSRCQRIRSISSRRRRAGTWWGHWRSGARQRTRPHRRERSGRENGGCG